MKKGNTAVADDAVDILETRALAALDLFLRACQYIDARTTQEKSVADRMSLEEEFRDFVEAHPGQPWNLDDSLDPPAKDLFRTRSRLFPCFEGFIHAELEKLRGDGASVSAAKRQSGGAKHQLALFALCRSGHAMDALKPRRPALAVAEAAIEDAKDTLDRLDLVVKGFPYPADAERDAEKRKQRRRAAAQKAGRARHKEQYESGLPEYILRRAAKELARQPNLGPWALARAICESVTEFAIEAKLDYFSARPRDPEEKDIQPILWKRLQRYWDEVCGRAEQIAKNPDSDCSRQAAEERRPRERF